MAILLIHSRGPDYRRRRVMLDPCAISGSFSDQSSKFSISNLPQPSSQASNTWVDKPTKRTRRSDHVPNLHTLDNNGVGTASEALAGHTTSDIQASTRDDAQLSLDFQYDTLDDPSAEIRLLRIHPSQIGGEIRCDIFHTRLDQAPSYTALSYSWGDTLDCHVININGSGFQVRQTLWDALNHVGSDCEPHILWIDSICINQEDTTERNHQVIHMRAIYERADRVLVWLGSNQDQCSLDLVKERYPLGLSTCGLARCSSRCSDSRDQNLLVHGLKSSIRPSKTKSRVAVLCIPYSSFDVDNEGFRDLQHWTGDCCVSRELYVSRMNDVVGGTCRWIFESEQFMRWREDPCGLFWLSGSPGTGKSMLISTVVRSLEANRGIGDHIVFYSADGDFKMGHTAVMVLWEILITMLLRDPHGKSRMDLRDTLVELAHAGDQFPVSKMCYFVTKMRHNLRKDETLYLFLDGLDQLEESPHDEDLLHELIDQARLYDPSHRIKCFISARAGFFRERDFQSELRVDLDSQPLTREDLALYVQDSLQNMKLPYSTREFGDLSNRLLNDAAGSFLWIRLVLQAIGVSYRSGQSPKTAEDLLNVLSAKDVSGIYANMLEQIRTSPESRRDAALSMLRWVTYVARPLYSWELVDALYRQTGIELKEADICNVSAGLLIPNGSQIRLAHFTLREYLQSQVNGKWDELSDEANEMIAHACLQALYPENLLQSLSLPSRNQLAQRNSKSHRQNLQTYAQRCWIFHYRLAEPRSSYLAGLLHDKLEESLDREESGQSSNPTNPAHDSDGRVGNQSMPRPQGAKLSSLDFVNTALSVGTQFGFPKLVKLELEMGANVNLFSGPDGHTPLTLAARGGYLDVVKLLLLYGANPDVASQTGNTPLMYAAANAHPEIVELLRTHSTKNRMKRNASPRSICKNILPRKATRELSLTVVSSTSCKICGEIELDYQVS